MPFVHALKYTYSAWTDLRRFGQPLNGNSAGKRNFRLHFRAEWQPARVWPILVAIFAYVAALSVYCAPFLGLQLARLATGGRPVSKYACPRAEDEPV